MFQREFRKYPPGTMWANDANLKKRIHEIRSFAAFALKIPNSNLMQPADGAPRCRRRRFARPGGRC